MKRFKVGKVIFRVEKDDYNGHPMIIKAKVRKIIESEQGLFYEMDERKNYSWAEYFYLDKLIGKLG